MAAKSKFGIIVGTRGFFSPALAAQGRKALLAKLDGMGYEYVILPADATPTGAVETLQDARKCARLFQEHRDELGGIIVSLPNFGDEIGIVNALQMADVGLPVLVQACDDDLDKVDVERRRDAFCGKLSLCNNLYQYGIPYTDTTYHTCPIGSDVLAEDIRFFESVCRVANGLRGARVGAVGARPTPFQTMRASEKLLQASGITVVTVDLSEIIFAARGLDDDAEDVKQMVARIRDYGPIPESIADEKVVRQARFAVALEGWIEQNDVQAAGVQCWTSVQENYGCAACLSMSMLSDRLIPCACEVDVAGAISMYALVLATGSPAALLDWNNNYGDDREMCINTHCSNYPRDFFKSDIEISNLDILGANLGEDVCFGAVKGKVGAGPMTYFRVSTDDRAGRIKTYVGEGEFTDDPCDMAGGVAVCRVPGLQQLMKYICRNGFEHHVAMVRSHCAEVLIEAVSSYLGWDWHRPG
ncbi:MAG: fucose isomerase [Planctomycetes bacterium SM23_32]|nr:MAG: fucose isomerase [Planctomycetes bacterium SM23_32]